jgi:hypothetical protein
MHGRTLGLRVENGALRGCFFFRWWDYGVISGRLAPARVGLADAAEVSLAGTPGKELG